MFRTKKLLLQFFNYYQLDTKALAFMRIALALVILADLWIRGGDLAAFYGEEGVLPSRLMFQFAGKSGIWTLCTLFQHFNWIVFLFVLNVIAAISFLIGYQTKISNLILWILCLSFQNRNLYILQGGDDLVRLLLFFGLFLPWHQQLSIDTPAKIKNWHQRLAQLAYLLLVASVYFFSVNLKSSSQWHSEGSALYYALSIDVLVGPFGKWLYHYPELMKVLTHAVYVIEWILPILILWPSKKGYLRLLAFLMILLLHLGFALFLNVGLFFIISIVSGIGLIPGQWLKRQSFKPSIKTSRKSKFEKFFDLTKLAFISVCIFLSLFVNLSMMPWFHYQPKKEIIFSINFLRLDQFWAMFAPAVPTQSKWLVYQAYNAKGQQYDIKNNSEYVDFNKPNYFGDFFKNDRWRKLAENVGDDRYTFLRAHYCLYFLETWNKQHPKKIMSTLNLYSMSQNTEATYKSAIIHKKILCVCDEH